MPRLPVVSRTMHICKVSVMTVNVNTRQFTTQELLLPRVISDERKLLHEVRKRIENDEVKVTHILSRKVVTARCVQTETEFLEHSTITEINNEKENEE